jgi:predicted Zn-dependent peptidase
LQESRTTKEQNLRTNRARYEEQFRGRSEYRQAEASLVAAREALDEERKRIEQVKSAELARLATRIEKLQAESRAMRDDALRKAHLFGRNPHPGSDAAKLKDLQHALIYHTTADWDYRTPEEVAGTAPQKMKQWLIRVRGY